MSTCPFTRSGSVQTIHCAHLPLMLKPTSTIAWSAVFPDLVDLGADGILTALEELRFAA